MFLSYNEAMGSFKATGSNDRQILDLAAAKMIQPLKMIVIVTWVLTIPMIAIALTIIGALIGIPGALGLWWVRKKAKASVLDIERAKTDYLISIGSA